MKTLPAYITALLLAPLVVRGAADAPKSVTPNEEKPTHYLPTRESLSQHIVPEWYQDAKIGFFYHWGPQSVVGDKFDKDALLFCRAQGKYDGTHVKSPPGQWGATMYPKPGKPDNLQNGAYLLHRKWYGDPRQFGYKDLIPLLTGEKFDPEGMVKLLDEAGVKYIAPMAVHHDGFAMWDSKVIDTFNAAKMGPKMDTTRLVVEAARKRGMKVGVSTHVMRHSWYYPKLEGYDTSDPRYVQLYGEGIEKDGLPKPAAIKKWEDTLTELIDTFHPDYIFSDGDTADIFCGRGSYVCTEAFRRIVAYYYNSAPAWGGEPVITFKRESLYKEEAVPDYEGGKLLDIAPYKWQTHRSICGWFYRNGENVTPSKTLFREILDVVSKNGNMLISLGLKPDGSMQDSEVAFLKDLATWTRVVGNGIFATRPWLVYGELEPGQESGEVELDKKGIVFDDPTTVRKGLLKLHEGDIRFTRSKDGKTIYAARLSWPQKPFTIASFSATGIAKDVKVGSLSLLGSNEQIKWVRREDGITIAPPFKRPFQDASWPVIFKMETERKEDAPTARIQVVPFQDNPIIRPIRIETGLVQGVPDQGNQVVAFKGIPYAAPPVGDLRWREPQPPLKWDGVREANKFGPVCPQPKSTTAGTLPWCLRDARDPEPPSFSEDCLFLNVWTPAQKATDKLAVLVFLNQGAFHGENLAQKGILVVTMNYRWGLLGGLGHPELTKESPHHLSGNYTLLDIIAALRWVHSNIAAFGGDPDKVTIAGYSVGSTIVHHLTTSPVAKGLFRAAICMSFPYDYLLKKNAVGNVWQKEQEGLSFAAAKKVSRIADLRKIPAQDLVAPDPAVSGRTTSILGSAFCRDGWALTTQYPEALDGGLASDVPTLTGLTADDSPGAPPLPYVKTTVASFAADVPKMFGEHKDAFLARQAAYSAFCPMTTDLEARAMLKRAQLEYRMFTVYSWAKRRSAKARTPVFTYLFDHALPSPEHPEFGAFHTSDLIYEFNNLETVDRPWREEDRRVAGEVSSYWVNFVRTGNPNGDNLPSWPPFDARVPSTMALGVKPGPRVIAGQERIGFYQDLIEK